MKKSKNTELFVCGLIGSGKDSVVKHLQKNDYWKIRIAMTMKSILQDVNSLSYLELEEIKRKYKEVRQAHHDTATILNNLKPLFKNLTKNPEVSLNRLELILNRESIEFENKINKFVINDVRSFDEIETIFKSKNKKIKGIFLLRTTDAEYVNATHWTNALNYNDPKLIRLLNKYKKRCIIVDNQGIDVENKWPTLHKRYEGEIISIDYKHEELTVDVLFDIIADTVFKKLK